jgi:hypothetical protein
MVTKTWKVLAGLAAVVLLLAASTQSLQGRWDNRVRLQAQLAPTAADPNAQGDAEFRSDSYDTELKVRVQNSTANDVVNVLLNGKSIGTITLDQYGDGELDLDARNGNTVPTVQAGDTITVTDAEDGTVLLTGKFATENR